MGQKRQHTAPSNPVLLYTDNKYSSVTVLVSEIQSVVMTVTLSVYLWFSGEPV